MQKVSLGSEEGSMGLGTGNARRLLFASKGGAFGELSPLERE